MFNIFVLFPLIGVAWCVVLFMCIVIVYFVLFNCFVLCFIVVVLSVISVMVCIVILSLSATVCVPENKTAILCFRLVIPFLLTTTRKKNQSLFSYLAQSSIVDWWMQKSKIFQTIMVGVLLKILKLIMIFFLQFL